MPTYEYRCKACGQELEVVQSFTDDALTTCEACGGALRKVFGSVGIAFKGSGFYKNDSRGRPATAAKSSDSGSGDGASTSGDKSSDGAKTDATPSPKVNGSTPAPAPTPKADKPATTSSSS